MCLHHFRFLDLRFDRRRQPQHDETIQSTQPVEDPTMEPPPSEKHYKKAARKCILPHTLANPWRPNSHVHDYPWFLRIPHEVHLRTFNPQRATWPRLQVPPTTMMYVQSPIRLFPFRLSHFGTNCQLSQLTHGGIFQGTHGCPMAVPVPRSLSTHQAAQKRTHQ